MKSCRRSLDRRLLAVIAVAGALGGCQTSYDGNEDSPYHVISRSARLILHQSLTIPAEQVAVWLQDGRAISPNDVRVYHPHCKFELRPRLPQAQTVAPDEFIVTRVTRALMHSARAPVSSTRLLAAVDIGVTISGRGGPSVQTFATRLDLSSARQPEVMRLTCGQWGYPYDGRHLTISEIRRTLGEIFTLRLADRRADRRVDLHPNPLPSST